MPKIAIAFISYQADTIYLLTIALTFIRLRSQFLHKSSYLACLFSRLTLEDIVLIIFSIISLKPHNFFS